MNNIYQADLTKSSKEKTYYSLAMFPYPSGAGLHVGHGSNFTANDIIARFKRMQGYTVINPMGWDSFGLPTENYAMKLGKPASEVTQENIAFYKGQCELMDWSYDWDREIATSDPSYYKRTQWIFQELFKAGLVYKKDAYVNRCPTDQTVLANDQVVDGCCERCGTEIIQKKHPQWFIKITDYAEKLIADLDLIDWPEETKSQQKYWIGKSEGAEIDFEICNNVMLSETSSLGQQNTILLLHGQKSPLTNDNNGWVTNVAEICKEKGYTTIVPFVDNSRIAHGIDREKALEDNREVINENTILVGHSAGGAAIVRWLGHNTGVSIAKLILVAPGKIPEENKTMSTQTGQPIDPKQYDGIKDLYNFTIDETIADRVRHGIFVLTSNDKERLLLSADMYIKTLHATHMMIENRGHFHASYGDGTINNNLPELITLIESTAGIKNNPITVFTTRPDTLFGVTALVLAPENASIDAYIPQEYSPAVEEYRKVTSKKTSVERQQDAETKSGVFSGVYAKHPLTGDQIPIWFADYVLPDYATGAVMFVPAHDERDWAFAKKHGLEMKQVILPTGVDKTILEKLLHVHNVIQDISEKNDIQICLTGGLNIPFYLGVIYRSHADLDYAVINGKEELFYTLLVDNGFTLVLRKESGVVVFEKDGVEIEVGTIDSIVPGYIQWDKKIDDKIYTLRGSRATILPIGFVEETKKAMFKAKGREKDKIDYEMIVKGAYTGSGILMNSGQFDGLDNIEVKKAITEYLEKQGLGKKKTTYKLRDWSVSRQRYWGSPIPVYYTFDSDEEVPFFSYEGNTLRAAISDTKNVTRNIVSVIIKDKSKEEYLIIKWHVDGTSSFVGGGVESGEDIIQAAIRETQEETGFTKVDFIKTLGDYQNYIYHPLKDINQYGIGCVVVVEVDKSENPTITEQELQKHEPLRVDEKGLYEHAAHDPQMLFFIDKYLGKSNDYNKYTPRYNAYNPHPDKSKRIPHLIPTDELPVILPLDLGNYKPAGKSPLADHAIFPFYHAPDGHTYLRECDTLDTFMCSSFYFIRYIDPKNTQELVCKEFAEKALPVDFYIGGKEHTYGHLLYSRFIHKFLYERGYVPCAEPFQRLFHQGMILGPDGRKMSKRRGNVITPADLVNKYGQEMGADVLRTYTMFMGPLEVEKAWNDSAVEGVKKFLDRVNRMADFVTSPDISSQEDITMLLHKTIKGVSEDIEKLKFNTAVSKMMVFVNAVYDKKTIGKDQLAIFLQLLAPFATKLTQEMRTKIGQEGIIHLSQRPQYDESLLADDTVTLPVQILGKTRGTLGIKKGASQEDIIGMIAADEKLQKYIEGKEIKKVIYVQDKIVNIVV